MVLLLPDRKEELRETLADLRAKASGVVCSLMNSLNC